MLLLVLFGALVYVEGCNEAVCGSIVSKCLLTKSCSCDLQTRTCSKDCFNCLGYLYTECCSCVDMCPKINETTNILSKKSHVEDFLETVPELFNVLTEYPDEHNRWNVTIFPVDIDISQYATKKQIKLHMKTAEQDIFPITANIITLNCTVVFWSQCMSWTKCKSSCLSMGSSSYRWFHDGCCECIGQHCINYGINESRCKLCPLNTDDYEITEENDLDYGEDDFDYDEEDM